MGVTLDADLVASVSQSIARSASALARTLQNSARGLDSSGGVDSALQQYALAALEQKSGVDLRKLDASVRQLRADGVTIANAEAGLFIAGTIGRFVDPKLGRDIETYGTAVLTIYRAFNSYASSSNTPNVLGIGAAFATGNVLGAVAGLAGMSGQGGDTSAAILSELRDLRKALEDLSNRMDARFDSIDKQLRITYSALNAGVERLERRLDRLEYSDRQIQADLLSLSGQLFSFERAVLNGQRQIIEEIRAAQTGYCLPWRRQLASDVPLPIDDFAKCAIAFAQIGTRTAAQDLEAGPVSWGAVDKTLAQGLAEPQTKPRQFLAGAISVGGLRLRRSSSLERLVSPRLWGAASRDYLNLLSDWPEYARKILPEQVGHLDQRGSQYNDAIADLQAALPDVLTAVLSRYFAEFSAIDDAIVSARERIVGHATPSLPSEARPAWCPTVSPTQGGSEYTRPSWIEAETFDIGSAIVPPLARTAEALGLGKIQPCVRVDWDIRSEAATAIPYVELRLYIFWDDGSRSQIASVQLNRNDAAVSIECRKYQTIVSCTYPSSNPYDGLLPGHLANLKQKAMTVGLKVEDARLASNQELLSKLLPALNARFGTHLAAKQVASTCATLPVDLQDSVSASCAYGYDTEVRARVETAAFRTAVEELKIDAHVTAAVARLDAYSRLARGLVEIASADVVGSNDILTSLLRGPSALPEGPWVMDHLDAAIRDRNWLSVPGARAVALATLVERATTQRKATNAPPGDQRVNALLAKLRAVESRIRE